LGMVKVREHAFGRKLIYEEARRLCLDLFCPNDFLMMMIFYLFFQKQKISLRPYTSGYSAPWNKEAHVMMCPP
jgi:hypothetical protein